MTGTSLRPTAASFVPRNVVSSPTPSEPTSPNPASALAPVPDSSTASIQPVDQSTPVSEPSKPLEATESTPLLKGSSVKLPKRKDVSVEGHAPVWSITRGEETDTPSAPLAALCAQHERPNQVCCRELKGEDERHLIDPDIVRDLIIGLSDGLFMPFSIAAGLSALDNSKIVIIAALAEIVSGAISMGVGGFLSAESERDHYRYLKATTHARVQRSCAGEMEREVQEVLGPLGIDQAVSRRVSGALLKVESEYCPPSPSDSGSEESFMRGLFRKMARNSKNGDAEADRLKLGSTDVGMTAFLLKFGEGLEDVPTSRLWISAMTIAGGYALGGIIPIIPYFFIDKARTGLFWSIGVTAIVLILFGCFKTYFSGGKIGLKGYTKSALSTLLVGAFAASASFVLVKLINPEI